MKKRFTEAQIVGFLREADAGVAVKDLCRKHGFSEASYYLWRSKFGGMSVSDAKRLKELETENTRLKKLLGGVPARERGDPRGAPPKVVTAPARRVLVRSMVERGLSERRALAVVRHERLGVAVHAGAGSECRAPRPHRRVGASASSLRRRHDLSEAAPSRRTSSNHKRVDRLYVEARLQIRRRRRKKVPVADRQPLRQAHGAERGVVGGLRVRSHGRGARAEVPGDRR